jgi:hypothetical protein
MMKQGVMYAPADNPSGAAPPISVEQAVKNAEESRRPSSGSFSGVRIPTAPGPATAPSKPRR